MTACDPGDDGIPVALFGVTKGLQWGFWLSGSAFVMKTLLQDSHVVTHTTKPPLLPSLVYMATLRSQKRADKAEASTR